MNLNQWSLTDRKHNYSASHRKQSEADLPYSLFLEFKKVELPQNAVGLENYHYKESEYA